MMFGLSNRLQNTLISHGSKKYYDVSLVFIMQIVVSVSGSQSAGLCHLREILILNVDLPCHE